MTEQDCYSNQLCCLEEIPPPTDADAPLERTDIPPGYIAVPPIAPDDAHYQYDTYYQCAPPPAMDTPPYTDADAPPPEVTHRDAFLGLDKLPALCMPPNPATNTALPACPDDAYYQYAATYEDTLPPLDPDDTALTAAEISQKWADAMPPECLTVGKRVGSCLVDVWAFTNWFASFADIRCISYQFYLCGKKIAVNLLKRTIVDIIRPNAEISAHRLSEIIGLLESFTTQPPPVVHPEHFSFRNQTLALHHHPAAPRVTLRSKDIPPCFTCHIPHDFNPNAGEPTRLLAFLNQLFAPDDLLTVQEYLGYCLMPNTKAQKALFIIGEGGEGKSRLTVLMKLVLGDACIVSSISQIGERFFGTMLENRLLFIDDDLQSAKFNATDAFKTLVTNETDVMVEPKHNTHYEIRPFTRFLLMGNQSVGSLHDRTNGFYRRVHIVNTLPAPRGRRNDPNLIQNIWQAEREAILLWLVKGGLRLARQNYKLTESKSSKIALTVLQEDDNTALAFLQEQTFVYGEGYSIPSSQMTHKYHDWCSDNDLFKVNGKVLKHTCEVFFAVHQVHYSNKVPQFNGYVRGFLGVCFG